jgi:hypothetical protein
MKNRSEDLVFKDESYAIVGACFAVYRGKNSLASFRAFSGLPT